MALDALSDVSDEALLVLYANGDPWAARALTLRLTPRLLGFAAWMLADRTEAEDVTQEAMLRLWRMAPDWRQGPDPQPPTLAELPILKCWPLDGGRFVALPCMVTQGPDTGARNLGTGSY